MEQENTCRGEQIAATAILGLKTYPHPELRVITYDFKRPDKFSLDQIKTVYIMHETFARLLTAGLAANLRLPVQARMVAVDQLTYGEFLDSIPDPSLLVNTLMSPLLGTALLQLDPTLNFSFLDRLLGGRGQTAGTERPLTDLEQKLLGELVQTVINRALAEAWSVIIDLKPSVENIEVMRDFALIVPPQEMVMLVSLEIDCQGHSGRLNLCLPYITIEPIIGKLSATYWYSLLTKKKRQPHNIQAVQLPVEAELSYPAGTLTLNELAAVIAGEPLRLEGYKRGQAVLIAGGVTLLELRRHEQDFEVVNQGEDEYTANLLLKDNTQPSFQEVVTGQLTGLRRELQGVLAGLDAKLSLLDRRQEELGDQFMLGLPEINHQEHQSTTGTRRPFEFIRPEDCDNLALLLKPEGIQLRALLLSYLTPETSALLLEKFPEEDRVGIIKRITALDRVPPRLIEQMEHHFETKLRQMVSSGPLQVGGLKSVVEILNHSSRSVERQIIETLEQTQPELAENIKFNMFVFEDIVMLDRPAIIKILSKTDPADLALALKKAPQEVREHILSCLETQQRREIETQVAALGKVRLRDVDASHQRIVNTIRRLEESGLIMVARVDETID